jgi:iron complex transport system ATP-binding protein
MKKISDNSVFTCRKLAVGYKDKVILKDMDLILEKGAFISLLGPNGAGKTTLLRTLSRHLDPLSGYIHLMGQPLDSYSPMDFAKIVAVVLTDKISPPLFTVFEFVSLGRYPHTNFLGHLSPDDLEEVQNALASVHASHLSNRFFSDLSDGERQKVIIARSLAQQPLVLMLDEPTVHLDLKHRVEVMSILRDQCMSRGITVIASLHDVDVAAKVSDHVALVKNGEISAFGPPESVLTNSAVTDLYDFRDAEFDRKLGSIEMRGNGSSGKAFVIGGMGTGAPVYRLLAKRGYSISSGGIHTNDLDYYVAKSLGVNCITSSPMEPINSNSVSNAVKEMENCHIIIDSGFDIKDMNRRNLEILAAALKKGKKVLSLAGQERESMLNISNNGLIKISDTSQLLRALDKAPLLPAKETSATTQIQESP